MSYPLGCVDVSSSPLLRLTTRHSRREARSLVMLNEQRATHRAVTLFPLHGVDNRLFGVTKLRSFRLVGPKKGLQQ